MNIEQIQCFISVADYQGLRRAVEALHKSQPAISNAIKKLESDLGFPLFDRSGYRMVLTPAGKQFYVRAKHIFQQWTEMQLFAKELNKPVEASINLMVDVLMCFKKLKQCLQHTMQTFPQTQLNISSAVLSGTVECLFNNQANLSISGADIDDYPDQSKLDRKRLCVISLIPVCSAKAYNENKQIYESSLALATLPQIVLKDTALLTDMPKKGMQTATHCIYVDDFYLKQHLILAGMGWGLMPKPMVIDFLKSGRLIKLKADHYHTIDTSVYALKRKDIAHGPCTQALWDVLDSITEN